MTTVFDVASYLLRRAGEPLSAVKLQKLCFYAFGWHAHLTGEALFRERFYAMEHGPVVGELLSAHAGRPAVTLEMISSQLQARESQEEQFTPYTAAVLDAVWDAYKGLSPWDLVELSHKERPWMQSWGARAPETRRGDLHQADLISYFVERQPHPEEGLDLPDPAISIIGVSDVNSGPAAAHPAFVSRVQSLSKMA